MKTILQREYGEPEQVLVAGETEVPKPGAGEVLVRVRATSVNTPDWIAARGVPRVLRLGSGLRRPAVAERGSDVAGEVVEVGEGVTEFAPGDAVFGSVWDGSVQGSAHGTFSEFTVVPARQLARLPTGTGFEDAAAAVMSGVTALQALRDVAGVRPGQKVLINGASGGVGLFAVQIARALGAEVTGVCSTANVELVRAAGAHHVVDYTQGAWVERGERYDVVMDNVMNHAPGESARGLVPGGVLLLNSIGGGEWVGTLPSMVWASLFGPKTWKSAKFDPSRENLEALGELLASGKVRVVIDSRWSLDDAGKAVARMASRRARGKVVITVGEG
ncbi:MAG: NAD(P)-dependent alcohol dehydrogenase [Myxococcaceae bacterium]